MLPRVRATQAQAPALDHQGRVGRQHVDVVGRDRVAIAHGRDRHGGVAVDDLRKHTDMARSEMRHDNIGQAAVRRDCAEQPLERLDAARRRTDANNGNALALWHAHGPASNEWNSPARRRGLGVYGLVSQAKLPHVCEQVSGPDTGARNTPTARKHFG